MPSAGPLIKLTNVTKLYGAADGIKPITVLDEVSLEVQPQESLAITGPSGSGKSTLLHIIGTLDRPTFGKVWLEGRDLTVLAENELATIRNAEIGFVFQAHYLLPQCTVLENVLVPTLAGGGKDRSAHSPASAAAHETPAERAERLLARVGLADRLSHRPGQLSGGERQRVALVRALINHPKLLLADEPTGSLDQTSADELVNLLVEMNQAERVTLVVVTHSKELAARMGRVQALRHGNLVTA